MALTALPEINSIVKTDEGSNTIITDSTVYGGANPDRNEVSVHLLAFKVDEDLEETALTDEDYDPILVEEFTVVNTDDGHQKFILFIIDFYNSLTTYAPNAVIYHIGTSAIYQNTSGVGSTGATPGVDATWEVITEEELYASIGTETEPDGLVYDVLQTVLTFQAQACLGLKASAHAKSNCAGCTDNPKAKDDFDELWLLVYLAAVASTRERFTEGERFMRSAEKYCDCC
jgi:hypothetical protein